MYIVFCCFWLRLGPGYVDVEEEFYSDPEGWLNGRYPQTHLDTAAALPPTHLIMFDTLTQVTF